MTGMVKNIAAVAGVALGAGIIAFARPEGLSFQAVAVLGILLWAITWWIIGILPEFLTGLIMAALFVLVANVPVETTFATFSTSTWWLLFAAFALGLGMKESGLMKRMALGIVRRFPPTFAAQSAALMCAGTAVGPLIPSLAVKGAMLAPLSQNISDAMGYARFSRQADGMFLSMLVGIRNIAPTVISASVTGYALLATLPADVQQRFDMLHWFLAALPWLVTVMILNYVLIVALYRPKRAEVPEHDLRHETLGAMSRSEKRMLVIILLSVCLWATERFHGIPAFAVGLVATVALFAGRIITLEQFKAKMNWGSLIFIGIALGLGPVFAYAGLNDWIMATCGNAFQTLAGNPYALVLGIGVITVLLRFLIVSEIAYLNLLMAFLVPMAVSIGVNPWVLGFSAYALVIAWFGIYQSPNYMAAFYATDKMVKHSHMAKYCAVYELTCLAGLAVSVPYWQFMGLL